MPSTSTSGLSNPQLAVKGGRKLLEQGPLLELSSGLYFLAQVILGFVSTGIRFVDASRA